MRCGAVRAMHFFIFGNVRQSHLHPPFQSRGYRGDSNNDLQLVRFILLLLMRRWVIIIIGIISIIPSIWSIIIWNIICAVIGHGRTLALSEQICCGCGAVPIGKIYNRKYRKEDDRN